MSAPQQRGRLFVISAPSGTGKSTVVRLLCKQMPELQTSVSCTTRPMRSGERDGVDYHFLSVEEFERRVASGYFAEWARVHNACYGTPRAPLEQAVASGHHVILDIDVQGGMALKAAFPDAVTVFLLPPDMATLAQRLSQRGTEDPVQVQLRLQNAKRELASQNQYDHRIINDDLQRAVGDLIALIRRYS